MTSRPITLRNFGGIHQLVVSDDQDLARIDALDAARWAATSAPIRDLHCDPAFLAFVDTEGKGRIRVAQVIAARDWFFARVKDRARLKDKSEELVLDAVDTGIEDGKKLRHAAEHVIAELKLSEKAKLKLADVRAFRATYAKTLANGDGVVPPETCGDAEVAAFLADLLAVVGGAPDASGAQGAAAAHLDKFLAGGKAYLAWKAKGEAAEVLPLGADTAAAWAAVQAVDAKVEEFFLRCDLLQQEALTTVALKLSDDELKALRGKDAAGIAAWLAAASLAPPAAGGTLPVGGQVNPAWQGPWADACAKALARLAPGASAIDRAAWRKAKAAFDAHAAWAKEKPAEPFEKVDAARLQALLDGPLPAKLRDLIAVDLAAAPELARVIELEKLVLYQRWLVEFANNFVSFAAVYSPSQTALVQVGSMVIDGRRLQFCTRVEDRAGHKAVAKESLIFLVYAQITDQDGKAAAFEVVAPVTAGERGRLRVGKRGIFIDNAGREWDATIVEMVEHGISIKEAALAPFRRAQKLIGDKIEGFVASQQASQEKALLERAGSGVDAAAQTAQKAASGAAPPPAAHPPEKKDGGAGMQNLLIGGSIAFAAIGSALAYVVSAVTSIAPPKLLGGVVGLVVAVAGISALLGWLKLRRRDMGLLFEASGWAINVQMKITSRLGVTFTRTPDFPEGTKVDRFDILADDPEVLAQDKVLRARRRRMWMVLLVAAAAVAIYYRQPIIDLFKRLAGR